MIGDWKLLRREEAVLLTTLDPETERVNRAGEHAELVERMAATYREIAADRAKKR